MAGGDGILAIAKEGRGGELTAWVMIGLTAGLLTLELRAAPGWNRPRSITSPKVLPAGVSGPPMACDIPGI